jgi:general secretion pathway protein G
MKLKCPYCHAIFRELKTPVCPACGHALRMAWETDLKKPGERAAFHAARGRRPTPASLRRTPRPPKPSLITLPWLLMNYRSRMFLWTLVLAAVIVGKLLFTHVSDTPLLPSDHRANELRSQKELLALRTGLEWFRAHCKRYPTDAEGLRALVRDPGAPGWHGYYINQLPPDPWGHPYVYSCTNGVVRLFGAGPDGRAGTADDIASPEPDWRALLERVSVRDLPHWNSNTTATAVTPRP